MAPTINSPVRSQFGGITCPTLGAVKVTVQSARATSPGFGLPILMGPEFPLMVANLSANLQSGACHTVQATCMKK